MTLTAGFAATQDIPADVGETQTTESGLKYSVLEAGAGSRKPLPTELVKVHYTGWLTDGTKFDSSRDRGEPAAFRLNEVIPGWTEGVQLMSPGAKYKFTIPSKLGYGERGAGGVIPPNAELIFEVELLELQPTAPKMDLENAIPLDNGAKYVVLTPGKGPAITEDKVPTINFAWYSGEGQFYDGTWKGGMPLPTQAMPQIKFMPELQDLMKVGGKYAVHAPKGTGYRDQVELWVFELVGLRDKPKMPKFVLPPETELTTTDSGLKYKILELGDAAAKHPTASDSVEVHYAGWLTDGTQFDASYPRGETASFPLRGVIGGWTEGLQLVKPGGKLILVIPPELGYGGQDKGNIPPNSTLVFHVELIAVK